MATKSVTVLSYSEIPVFAATLAKQFQPGDTVLLFGGLGAGKTTLVSAILKEYGMFRVSSPTFSLVNVYDGAISVAHIDLYRLDGPDSFFSINLDDYFSCPDTLVFVEWSEKLGDFLPQKYHKIELDWVDEYHRRVCVSLSLSSESDVRT